MAHEYSVLVHNYLMELLKKSKKEHQKALDDRNKKLENFYNGKVEEVLYLRKYLTDKIDLDTQTYYT